MFQRDYILNEAKKFAELLARLLSLKTEGKHQAYKIALNTVLQNEYDAELENLLALTEDSFTAAIQKANYSAEKLNALGQLLFVFAQPFTNSDKTILTLKKVLIIFDMLEQKHHYQSYQNIESRKIIYQYLSSISQPHLEEAVIPLNT